MKALFAGAVLTAMLSLAAPVHAASLDGLLGNPTETSAVKTTTEWANLEYDSKVRPSDVTVTNYKAKGGVFGSLAGGGHKWDAAVKVGDAVKQLKCEADGFGTSANCTEQAPPVTKTADAQ